MLSACAEIPGSRVGESGEFGEGRDGLPPETELTPPGEIPDAPSEENPLPVETETETPPEEGGDAEREEVPDAPSEENPPPVETETERPPPGEDDGAGVALFVRTSGLYAVDLKSGAEVCVDAGPDINRTPSGDWLLTGYERSYHLELAEDGTTAVYTKNGGLYIGVVDFSGAPATPVLVHEEVMDFTLTGGSLLYAPKSGGLFTYHLASGAVRPIIDGTDSRYRYIVARGGAVFAYKERIGVVQADISRSGESLIIPDVFSESGLIHRPVALSADGRYLLAIRRTSSGSISADGVSLVVYDVESGGFIAQDPMGTLPNRENVSIDPAAPGFAYIEGGGRAMSFDKALAMMNPVTGRSDRITEDTVTVMNPCFSADGTKVAFSAWDAPADFTYAWEAVDSLNSAFYEQHSICEYDRATGHVRTLVDSGFNIWPCYIGAEALTFARLNGDTFDLYVYENGGERLAAAGICTYDVPYYGYYNLMPVLHVAARP
jgi:hypothetical protein